jgi:hypothetical protein
MREAQAQKRLRQRLFETKFLCQTEASHPIVPDMDGIDLLRQQAFVRRAAAIQAAKRDYHAALVEIAALVRKLNLKQRGRPCKIGAKDYTRLEAASLAMEILREGKAWSLVELTIDSRFSSSIPNSWATRAFILCADFFVEIGPRRVLMYTPEMTF